MKICLAVKPAFVGFYCIKYIKCLFIALFDIELVEPVPLHTSGEAVGLDDHSDDVDLNDDDNHDDVHNEVQLVEVQQDENEDDFNCLTDSESEDEIGDEGVMFAITSTSSALKFICLTLR